MVKVFDKYTFDIFLIIRPIIYIVIGIIVYGIIKKILKQTNNKISLTNQQNQRVKTLKMLILNVIKYIIVIIEILAILSNFGINVSSLVAGLGVTTAIIGLAFQDLAKDFISGFSIITEAQYDVGDTIEVDGFMGEVIFLGLKTTRIRNYKGATKIISNRNMDKIINYSLHNSLAVVDVLTDYSYAPEKIEKILEKLSDDLDGKIPESRGKLSIWGVNELEDSGVSYTVVVEVKPMSQYAAERFIKQEIKKAFDKENIKIPVTQIEVHNGK